MPRPPCARSGRALLLDEGLKHARQEFGRNADSGVLYADEGLVSLAFRREPDLPPSSVYFAALLSRFDTTCVSLSRSPSSQIGSAGWHDRQSMLASIDQRLADLDRPRDDGSHLAPALFASGIWTA